MRRQASLLVIGTAIIIATALAATGLVSASPVSVGVEITDAGFNPPVVTVPPHSTVTWTNAGSESHSIVGESGNALESPNLAPRFTYSYTFHSTGSYAYHDARTPLKGIIIVQEGAGAPEPDLNSPPPATSFTPQAAPISPSEPEILIDNPAGGDTPLFGGAASAPPNISL